MDTFRADRSNVEAVIPGNPVVNRVTIASVYGHNCHEGDDERLAKFIAAHLNAAMAVDSGNPLAVRFSYDSGVVSVGFDTAEQD